MYGINILSLSIYLTLQWSGKEVKEMHIGRRVDIENVGFAWYLHRDPYVL
jgi:hypothetical protein